ncbi:hypothetical protein ACLKA7_003885 [Drosophila subpalustris]
MLIVNCQTRFAVSSKLNVGRPTVDVAVVAVRVTTTPSIRPQHTNNHYHHQQRGGEADWPPACLPCSCPMLRSNPRPINSPNASCIVLLLPFRHVGEKEENDDVVVV